MKRFAILIILLFALPVKAQLSQELKKKTFIYKDSLQLDYYSLSEGFKTERPLLVLMHGGGFASDNHDRQQEVDFCRQMASHGYAVASINYRLTRKNDPFSCDCGTDEKMKSFVMGSEDLAAATTFLIGRDELTFDRRKIVLVGSSAGAETVLHNAFMKDHYLFRHIPEIPVAGLVSFSGAMVNSAYITAKNAVPVLLIHGKKDLLVPTGTAPHHYCSEDSPGYLMLDGPETLLHKIKDLNTSYIYAFDPEGGHEIADEAFLETTWVKKFVDQVITDGEFMQLTIQLP
jgi:acetyl esterase/lipase